MLVHETKIEKAKKWKKRRKEMDEWEEIDLVFS